MYHAVDVIIVVIIGLLEAEWGNHDSTPHRTARRAECADGDSKHHPRLLPLHAGWTAGLRHPRGIFCYYLRMSTDSRSRLNRSGVDLERETPMPRGQSL